MSWYHLHPKVTFTTVQSGWLSGPLITCTVAADLFGCRPPCCLPHNSISSSSKNANVNGGGDLLPCGGEGRVILQAKREAKCRTADHMSQFIWLFHSFLYFSVCTVWAIYRSVGLKKESRWGGCNIYVCVCVWLIMAFISCLVSLCCCRLTVIPPFLPFL